MLKASVIPLAPMGVLAPRSVHARPSARPPIDTIGNFPAHVSAVTFTNFPHPLRSNIRSFRTLGKVLKIFPLTPPIYDIAGGRGGPQLFYLIGILIFLLVRSPCKIWELFLGDLADDGRRERGERREKIMPSLMATSLHWRTHSARTN